jgi:hypothetical protein
MYFKIAVLLIYKANRKTISKFDIKNESIFFVLVPWESSSIPKPTPAQLKYQKHEIMALIHFNMGTFSKDGGSDPSCNKDNWNQRQDYATGST